VTLSSLEFVALGAQVTKGGGDEDQAESAASSEEGGRRKDRGAPVARGIPRGLVAAANRRHGAFVAAGRGTATRVW